MESTDFLLNTFPASAQPQLHESLVAFLPEASQSTNSQNIRVEMHPVSMSIKHDHILNPITALEFVQDGSGPLLVLAGEGSYVKVYHAETSELLSQCEVFSDQAIHGIAVCPSRNDQNALQLVIWGGPYLQLIRTAQFRQVVSQEVTCITDTVITASDWILDASIPLHDFFSCALVTAHNTVLRARLDDTTDNILLEAVSSPSRSILYSAHLTWESDSSLLIAAGTVFGEIIMWECSLQGDSRTLFTFIGHEGSIFGVNISPPISYSNGMVTRLLASCSDDRTIRIWNLIPNSLNGVDSDNQLLLPETGFGPKDKSTCEDTKPIAVVMAHASRIWRVRFLSSNHSIPGQTSVGLLSFGEDATTIHWALEFEPLPPTQDGRICLKTITESDPSVLKANLALLDTFSFHSGKHIWSTAICTDGTISIVGTGGADGKISMFEALRGQLIERPKADSNGKLLNETGLSTFSSYCESCDVVDVLDTLKSRNEPGLESSTPLADVQPEELPAVSTDVLTVKNKKKKPKNVPKDSFNKYAFISEDDVLVTTAFGRILHGRIRKSMLWTEVELPSSAAEDLSSYSVVAGFPEIELAYFGSAHGNIYGCRVGRALMNTAKVDGKVADLFKIYDSEAQYFGLLVTVLMSGVAKFFHIDQVSLHLSSGFEFTLPEKFVITSASKINGIFIFGSRFGSLALYDPAKPESPLVVHKVVKGGAEDAITSILPLPSTVRVTDISHFLATRRDGAFSIFSIQTNPGDEMSAPTVDIYQVHEGTPPLGSKIENAWLENNDLYLYGFKSRNFIVWNETKQCEVTSIECGGAHRSYAYSSFQTGGHFIYTKASKLYLHSHTGSSHRTIKPGGHGREIKSCAVSQDQAFIATGAEDTAIRIWSYNQDLDSRFNCKVAVQKHTTGIQYLQWFGSEYLLSSGGNEEFFIFKISSIPNFGIGVVCEATCPDQSEERDLRITCFDIMDVHSPDNEVLITLAYSDSTIRSYFYSKATGFKLIATGRYTSSCITQLRYLNTTDGKVWLLTAATDGYVTTWNGILPDQSDKPNELSILSTTKVHQSTIKSWSLIPSTSSDFVLIATGGDDNALGFSVFPLFPSTHCAPAPTVFVLKSAHATAITGLAAVPVSGKKILLEQDRFRFVSSGNDQQVKMWEVQVKSEGEIEGVPWYQLKVKMVAQRFTAVADVGDLTVFRAKEESGEDGATKVLVLGNGMESWDVES